MSAHDKPNINAPASLLAVVLQEATEQELYLTCKVKQRVHLHQVVLDRRAADDDAYSNRDLLQPLHQLHLGVLDFVALPSSNDDHTEHTYSRVEGSQ